MQPLWIYHQALRSAAAAEIVPPSGEASASETRSSCSMKLVLTSRDKLDAASSSEPPHSLSTRSMICLPMLGKMAHSRSTAGVDILLEMDETDEHHESSPSGVSVVASLLHELSLPVGVTVTMGFAGVAAVAVAVACELDSCPAGPTDEADVIRFQVLGSAAFGCRRCFFHRRPRGTPLGGRRGFDSVAPPILSDET